MHVLTAGVFSIRYENGFLRHIKYGELEIIRMIYMALRDQNWSTFAPIIENEIIEKKSDSFRITYDCFHELAGTRIFQWQVEISGTSESVIAFEIKGTALTDVVKNRAGLCILHPIKSTAGMPCEMLRPNGDQIKKIFPVYISAENPFKNLRGLRWRCQYDWYVLQFEGDEFETEDQRNWSDASYKTFCTPLSKPFPVEMKAGATVHQKVTFQPEGYLLPIPGDQHNRIEIKAFEKSGRLPNIGIAASTETDTLSQETIHALQSFSLHHYRIEVHPSFPSWTEKFTIDCKNAELLKLPLEIALHVSSPKELKSFCDLHVRIKPATKRIILLSQDHPATTEQLIDEYEVLRREIQGVQIGAGTDYNFRELNCNPFPGEWMDFISYSIDPQEHAVDDLTIIENIDAQADTVASAKLQYGEFKPIHIGSLTLKKRFNPAATVPADKILPDEQKKDPRQKTGFTAAFTLGSIKTLAQAEASSVTLYQTVGDQGLMRTSGEPYPVFHVLKEVLAHGLTDVIYTSSTRPLLCDALLLQKKDKSHKLMVANYTADPQRVIFRKDEFILSAYEIRVVEIK